MPPVFAAAVVVFCEGLVLWSVFPIMHYYAAELGGGPRWVGLLFALLSAPRVFSNPIFGRLSERFGRRPLMAVASLGTLLGSVGWALAPRLAGLAPGIWWLALSRMVAGVFGAQAALSAAVVADVTPPGRRAAGMGVLGAAFGLSMVLGPLLGGWVTTAASHALVGWVGAGLQALSVVTVLCALRETRPAGGQAHASGQPWFRPVWFGSQIQLLLGVTLLATLALSQVTTTFSMLADRVYHFTERDAGHAFALLGLVATLVQGGVLRLLLKRWRERAVSMAGLLLLAAGAAAVALEPPTWGLWLSLATIGVGVALSTPTVTALLSRCVAAHEQGALMGMHQGVTALGRGLGAPLAGVLFAGLGPSSPYVVTVGVMLVAAGLLVPVRGGGAGQ